MLARFYRLFHRRYHLRYHGIYRHAKKLFVFDIFLIAAAVAAFGVALYFFLWRPDPTALVDLTLSLEEGRHRSGETIVLTVSYANRGELALNDAMLIFDLPPGFVISGGAEAEQIKRNHSLELGAIGPGEQKEISVRGRLWLTPKTEEKARVILTYRPAGEATENKTAVLLFNLPESILESRLEIPSPALANAPLPFTYTLKNLSSETVDGISVASNIPFRPSPDQPLKNISLAAGAEQTIAGSFMIPPRDDDLLLRLNAAVSANNHLVNQTVAERNIKLFAPMISVRAEILNDDPWLEAGQIVPVRIAWKNSGPSQIDDARLRLSFAPAGSVDVAATAEQNGLRAGEEEIYIDKNIHPALKTVLPSQSGEIILDVVFPPRLSLGGTENARWSVTPALEAETSVVGQPLKQTGESASRPLSTELFLRASARYYADEGDQLGRGPLPPRIGETTKYWIFIQIINTSNKVSGARFHTTLPPAVNFTSRQSVTIGPPLRYEETGRLISWEHNELPANSQTRLYFEVAATPMPEQVGKILPLTNALYLSAVDGWTGKQFNLMEAGLTNALPPEDKGAAVSGAVGL